MGSVYPPSNGFFVVNNCFYVLAFWGCLCFLQAKDSQSSWNQLRGPDGSGVAPNSRPPLKIDPAEAAWKQEVPAGLSSPVLAGERIFFTGLEDGRLVTVALDKKTGKRLWSRPAPKVPLEKTHEANGPATPTPWADDDHVFTFFGSYGLLCYDHDGKELWKVYHGGFNAAARPLYTHGHVIINLEGGKRLLSVRPDGTGDVTKTHVEWTCGKSTPTRPSQLVVGDHLYMVNDKGVASCLDIETGEPTWTERLEGRHSASPIYADGRLYFFEEDKGTTKIVAADPKEFHLLAENKLDKGCMASPGVIDDALLIRTRTHIYRIEAK